MKLMQMRTVDERGVCMPANLVNEKPLSEAFSQEVSDFKWLVWAKKVRWL